MRFKLWGSFVYHADRRITKKIVYIPAFEIVQLVDLDSFPSW